MQLSTVNYFRAINTYNGVKPIKKPQAEQNQSLKPTFALEQNTHTKHMQPSLGLTLDF